MSVLITCGHLLLKGSATGICIPMKTSAMTKCLLSVCFDHIWHTVGAVSVLITHGTQWVLSVCFHHTRQGRCSM